MPTIAEIVKSDWFPFITGFASILGVMLTLYQFRIKNAPFSKLRAMEWRKNILTSFGVGVVVTSLILFYNQERPSADVMGVAWDKLHGAKYESVWAYDSYKTVRTDVSRDFSYSMNAFDLLEDGFKFYLTVTLNRPSDSSNSNTVEKPTSNENATNRAANNSNNAVSEKMPEEFRKLPDAELSMGEIKVAQEYKSVNYLGSDKAWVVYSFRPLSRLRGKMTLHLDNQYTRMQFERFPESSGTSVWGGAAFVGFILICWGVLSNPFRKFKSQILHECRELDEERYRKLSEILGGKTYEQLKFHEKQRYDQTSEFYRKTQAMVFKTLSGEEMRETGDYKIFQNDRDLHSTPPVAGSISDSQSNH